MELIERILIICISVNLFLFCVGSFISFLFNSSSDSDDPDSDLEKIWKSKD